LLCFIGPILGNRYVRSWGFIVSEPRETHPRSEIADVPTLPCPPLDNLGPRVSGSSPCTLTTSLAIPVPSSFSVTGTPFTQVKLCLNFFHEILFKMYGDSRNSEYLLENLEVVIILSPPSVDITKNLSLFIGLKNLLPTLRVT